MNTALAASLLVSLLLTCVAAASGALFRPDQWYAALRKPPGLPPRWVFPTVWTVLYVLMAIAAALVYRTANSARIEPALAAYGMQLAANAAWSWLFFGRHRPFAALLDLLALLWLLALTLVLFAQIDSLAATLLAPYLLWLCVALYLNTAVWWLNRHTVAHGRSSPEAPPVENIACNSTHRLPTPYDRHL